MDLDRLHNIFLSNKFFGRGTGLSTAVCYQAYGFSQVLVSSEIYILTNLRGNVENLDNILWDILKEKKANAISIDDFLKDHYFEVNTNKIFIIYNEGVYNEGVYNYLRDKIADKDNVLLLFDFIYQFGSITSAQCTWEEYNQIFANYIGGAALQAMKNIFGGGNVEINVNLW